MGSNMFWLAVFAGLVFLIYLGYLYFRPKEHVDVSPLRLLLNVYFAALRSEYAQWHARDEEGSLPVNMDTETGLFKFTSPDGSIHAIYEAMGMTSRLRIMHGEHQADIAYIGATVSNVAFDRAILEDTHADLRQNSAFLRKLRSHTRSLIGFRVAPEELEEAPREFAKPTGRTINYGRDGDNRPRKKKRPQRTKPTGDE